MFSGESIQNVLRPGPHAGRFLRLDTWSVNARQHVPASPEVLLGPGLACPREPCHGHVKNLIALNMVTTGEARGGPWERLVGALQVPRVDTCARDNPGNRHPYRIL